MTKQKKILGKQGEEEAEKFLQKKGLKILQKNLQFRFGEIDILACDKDTIVLCEIKTVSGGGWGLPQELVRWKKQQKLRLLARAISQKYPRKKIRVDVLGIDWSGLKPRIEHIINAVEGI